MRYPDRATVRVSTQAGCAMACSFCATGQAGFTRHLTTGEIVEQVVRARRAALPRRLSNVVFMGMGEPLANYGPLWAAVERLHHDLGCRPGTSPFPPSAGAGHRQAHGRGPAREPGRVPPRRQRHPPRRARPHQPALPAGRPAGRLPGLCRGQGPAPVVRVGPDRRGQRPPVGRRRAGRRGHPPRRPRQPHPPQPDPRVPGAGRRRPRCGPSATGSRGSASTPPSAATGAPTSTPPAASWRPGGGAGQVATVGDHPGPPSGTGPLGRAVDAFVPAVAPTLTRLAGDSRIADTHKLPGDVALEAFNLTAAFVDADGRHTDDELDAFVDVFGPRFDTVARAASPNAMRVAGLLTGSRTFLDTPSALFALLVQADGHDGGTGRGAYYTGRPRHRAHGAGPRRVPRPRRAVRRRTLPHRPAPGHGRGRRPRPGGPQPRPPADTPRPCRTR